jgi:hypothetical protein
MFMVAFIISTADRWTPPKCPPISKWINKMRYIRTVALHTYILFGIKKLCSDTCYDMDGP